MSWFEETDEDRAEIAAERALIEAEERARCTCGRRLVHLVDGEPPVCVYCRSESCTCEPLDDDA